MEHPYPHFAEALRAYGNSAPKIAKALGVSTRSALGYLRGEALPHVKVVKRHPTIDAALTLDLAPRLVDLGSGIPKTAENSSQIAS